MGEYGHGTNNDGADSSGCWRLERSLSGNPRRDLRQAAGKKETHAPSPLISHLGWRAIKLW